MRKKPAIVSSCDACAESSSAVDAISSAPAATSCSACPDPTWLAPTNPITFAPAVEAARVSVIGAAVKIEGAGAPASRFVELDMHRAAGTGYRFPPVIVVAVGQIEMTGLDHGQVGIITETSAPAQDVPVVFDKPARTAQAVDAG